jgi:hypothetical protein
MFCFYQLAHHIIGAVVNPLVRDSEDSELTAIETVQAIAGHHPDKAFAILMYLADHALAKAVFKPVFCNKKAFGSQKGLCFTRILKQTGKDDQEKRSPESKGKTGRKNGSQVIVSLME